MLLESIDLGRSHRDSRHALSRLSNHQGSTSGCYDIRHEKNGVHWEGCPNYNPSSRQLATRDQLSMGRMRNSGRGIPRLGDSISSMGLSSLQRNHFNPTERYFEGSGGMEALAIGGTRPRSRNIGQNPGGLEALRLGGQDLRGRNPSLHGAPPTGQEQFEGLGNRRLPSSLASDHYAAFEHLMNHDAIPRSSHRRLPNPSRQSLREDEYLNSRMQNPRYQDPRVPSSPMQFQDLGPGPPEIDIAPKHHPAVYYGSNSPRPPQRSTPRMMYNEMAMSSPHPHHSFHQQSPNPLMYGEMDSPLTSSRYGSIHSPTGSNADLHRSIGIEQMRPYATHGHVGSRNHLGGHDSRMETNYQSPYVEDWVSEAGMGVQDEMLQRQAAMEGGLFYDERGGMEGDGYGRSRLV
ncbi:hypothetical protein MFRU_011g02800 [Monilinia fructicola]|uniref:Uncharacterized protein n=1 Tax=Monilinia fructicola TaxID=38448 RepID=A0A5M9JN10_MONFR|nr:hypothetical protein EYC84_000049 [Monilinia fructicola]KAG4030828.1 hypothetical protein MFRU_011g02800 [Monilinia fructicola]